MHDERLSGDLNQCLRHRYGHRAQARRQAAREHCDRHHELLGDDFGAFEVEAKAHFGQPASRHGMAQADLSSA